MGNPPNKKQLIGTLGEVMTGRQRNNPYYAGGVYRAVWGAAGLLFVAFGLFVVLYGVVGLPIRIGAGLLIILLGAEAIWSTLKSKQSYLAKMFLFI